MLTRNKVLKLADFGLSKKMLLSPNKNMDTNIGTLKYRAPEVILGIKDYTLSVDVWSIGCIFGELYKGEQIFNDCFEGI